MLPLTSHRVNCSFKGKYVHDSIFSNQAQRERCLTSGWNRSSTMTNILTKDRSSLLVMVQNKIMVHGFQEASYSRRHQYLRSGHRWWQDTTSTSRSHNYVIELILLPTPSRHKRIIMTTLRIDFEIATQNDPHDFEVFPDQLANWHFSNPIWWVHWRLDRYPQSSVAWLYLVILYLVF